MKIKREPKNFSTKLWLRNHVISTKMLDRLKTEVAEDDEEVDETQMKK